MSVSAKLRRAPLRIATGAFILNTGITKLSADDDTAKSLHGMASGAYPFLGKAEPKVFVKGLAVGEIAVGSALLLPIVSPIVAGAALAAFSGGLLNMYWHTPGLHEEGSPRPTAKGVPIAKDVWMFGIGTGMVADALLSPAHDKHVELGATVSEKRAQKSRRAKRKVRKAGRAAAAEQLKHASELQAEAAKRARRAAKTARRQAEQASDSAAKRLAEARAEYGPVAAEKAKHARDTARDLAHEYGPVAAEKAKHARDTARDLAGEYGPIAVDKAKQARHAAQEAGAKARERMAS